MGNGFVGNLTTITSERSRALRQEREADQLAFEERENERQMAPVRALEAELNQTHKAIAKENTLFEQQQLRYRLGHEPSEFTGTPYDGRFKDDRAAMENAVKDAGTACMQRYGLNDSEPNFKLLVNFVTVNAAKVDVSRAENWFAAWRFICKAFADLEKSLTPEPAPEPVAPKTTVAPEDQTAADLQRQIDALPVGNSRERERLERLLHQHQIKKELLLDNKNFRDVMLTICDDSGLQIPAKVNLQFIDFLKSPAAREYQQGLKSSDLDEYALNLRLAFSQFTATGENWLTVPEKQEQARRRNIAGYTSSQVKDLVGSTNTFGYDPGQIRRS